MFFKVEDAAKFYGRKKVLHEINFSVEKGELVSIIGPSGAGKTTLLKLIAGLEPLDAGRIIFESEDRKTNPVILVFQDYVLFPFMNVFENIAFGLRTRKEDSKAIKEKVTRMLSYFHLTDKAHSYPNRISAGQKQRAAIARALVVNPAVLLLDEPFANLDRNLKLETAEFLRSTQKEFNITTIAVTHDLQEAFLISDRLGVMLEGRLCQYGDAGEIYHDPASLEIAKFLGHVNIIPADHFKYFESPGLNLPARETVYARAESFELVRDDSGLCEVTAIAFAGNYIIYTVKAGSLELKIYGINNSIKTGDRVGIKLLRFF